MDEFSRIDEGSDEAFIENKNKADPLKEVKPINKAEKIASNKADLYKLYPTTDPNTKVPIRDPHNKIELEALIPRDQVN